MKTANPGVEFPASTRTMPALLLAALTAACGGHGPPAVAPRPGAIRPAGIVLRDGWRATVLVQRNDSIVLTLPNGEKQLQRFDRHAGFTLAVDGDGEVSVRLDSLTLRPRTSNVAAGVPVGATWTGRANDVRVNAIRASGGGDPTAELTTVVRDLLPRLPVSGVRANMSWADSGTGEVRVDIFRANEHRSAAWSTGAMSARPDGQTLPVQLREEFEQVGDGLQGGRRMTMTSQGRRTATYYLTPDGRISSAELDDSAAVLISIPDTRQVVPTIRFARTTVRFVPLGRSESN